MQCDKSVSMRETTTDWLIALQKHKGERLFTFFVLPGLRHSCLFVSKSPPDDTKRNIL